MSTRKKSSPVWNHFVAVVPRQIMRCNHCNNQLRISHGCLGNLTRHLRRKHPTIKLHDKPSYTTSNLGTKLNEEEESVEDPLWSYFEREAGVRARCVVCCAALSSDTEALSQHLKKKHPKLLPRTKTVDSAEDNDIDDQHHADKGDLFTEVVYLEESLEDERKQYSLYSKSPPKKKKQVFKDHDKVRKPVVETVEKENHGSDSDSEECTVYIRKSGKTIKKESKLIDINIDDDIDNFGKYVTSLLRKVPLELATKLQMDIVHLIMKAKLNYELSLKTETEKTCAFIKNVDEDTLNVAINKSHIIFEPVNLIKNQSVTEIPITLTIDELMDNDSTEKQNEDKSMPDISAPKHDKIQYSQIKMSHQNVSKKTCN